MKMNISRRTFLASSVIVAVSQLATKAVAEESSTETGSGNSNDQISIDDNYTYEVNYTEAEWKARLTEKEFSILRLGETEEKKSSPLWNEKREGLYHCKGCELTAYESKHKFVINKGWAFFKHSKPNSVLTDIDLYTSYDGRKKKNTVIEVHCRRCGSHLGHVLYIKRKILHCINGTALIFKPTV